MTDCIYTGVNPYIKVTALASLEKLAKSDGLDYFTVIFPDGSQGDVLSAHLLW